MAVHYKQSAHQAHTQAYYMMRFMEIFSLPTEELLQFVKTQFEINPFLEEDEDIIDEAPESDKTNEDTTSEVDMDENNSKEDEIDWEQYVANMDNDYTPQVSTKEENSPHELIITEHKSLMEHLTEQLHLLKLEPLEIFIGELIIGNLDEEGFFIYRPHDVNLMAQQIKNQNPEFPFNIEEITLEKVSQVLAIIQRLDPVGIAAQDFRESILIQLDYYQQKDSLEYRIVDQFFNEIQNKKYPQIARQLNVSREEIIEAEHRIRLLDPRPGVNFYYEPIREVIPDVIVEKSNGDDLNIFMNDSRIPHLRINQYYQKLLKNDDKSIETGKDYLKERLNAAKWLIDAIEQRKSTIKKIAANLVNAQHEFFINGPECLKPLTLKDVADQIGVHPTTVGRIVNNKYMQTEYGVFNMKYFFSAKLKNDDNDEDLSARLVMELIKQQIEREDTDNPLSDNRIVEILKIEHSIVVARRTVTKYREKMGILPSRLRKKN